MRALRRLIKRDDGLTLIELLVAMILLGILLTVVSGLYISSLRAVTVARGQTGNTKVASNAMNESSRVIRAATENPLAPPLQAAPAIVSATADDILLYAYINLTDSQQIPQLIRLRVDRTNGNYVESSWPASPSGTRWTFPVNPCVTTNTPVGCTAPKSKITLASAVPASHVNVFQYFDNAGAPIAIPSGGLGEDARKLVASVEVTMVIQPSLTDSSNPVTLENKVGMPNLGFAKESL